MRDIMFPLVNTVAFAKRQDTMTLDVVDGSEVRGQRWQQVKEQGGECGEVH